MTGTPDRPMEWGRGGVPEVPQHLCPPCSPDLCGCLGWARRPCAEAAPAAPVEPLPQGGGGVVTDRVAQEAPKGE